MNVFVFIHFIFNMEVVIWSIRIDIDSENDVNEKSKKT